MACNNTKTGKHLKARIFSVQLSVLFLEIRSQPLAGRFPWKCHHKLFMALYAFVFCAHHETDQAYCSKTLSSSVPSFRFRANFDVLFIIPKQFL